MRRPAEISMVSKHEGVRTLELLAKHVYFLALPFGHVEQLATIGKLSQPLLNDV
jgi:hypothetical protein